MSYEGEELKQEMDSGWVLSMSERMGFFEDVRCWVGGKRSREATDIVPGDHERSRY